MHAWCRKLEDEAGSRRGRQREQLQERRRAEQELSSTAGSAAGRAGYDADA